MTKHGVLCLTRGVLCLTQGAQAGPRSLPYCHRRVMATSLNCHLHASDGGNGGHIPARLMLQAVR